jgi:hypothetical protein
MLLYSADQGNEKKGGDEKKTSMFNSEREGEGAINGGLLCIKTWHHFGELETK